MRLKSNVVTHTTGGEQIMVGVGSADFHGYTRNNETAAFIVDCLKTDTTPGRIVDRLAAEYPDVPRARLETDVGGILKQLKNLGVLED